jgi:hypothetical protein
MSNGSDVNPQQLSGQQLLERISQHILLVCLHISWPKLRYQLKNAIVEIQTGAGPNDKEAIPPELLSDPHLRLMPEDWGKRFANLEGRARRRLSGSAITFSTGGMALLPITRAEDIFNAFAAYRDELADLRREFASDYVHIVSEKRRRLQDGVWTRIAHKIPEPHQIEGKFGITWPIIPIGSGSGGFSPEHINRLRAVEAVLEDIAEGGEGGPYGHLGNRGLDDVRAILHSIDNGPGEISDDTARTFAAEVQQNMSQFAEEFARTLVDGPIDTVCQELENVVEGLRTGRRLSARSFNELQQSFSLLRGFSFAAPRDVIRRVEELATAIDEIDPARLNQDNRARGSLVRLAENTLSSARNAESRTNALRSFRNITFREEEPEPQPTS